MMSKKDMTVAAWGLLLSRGEVAAVGVLVSLGYFGLLLGLPYLYYRFAFTLGKTHDKIDTLATARSVTQWTIPIIVASVVALVVVTVAIAQLRRFRSRLRVPRELAEWKSYVVRLGDDPVAQATLLRATNHRMFSEGARKFLEELREIEPLVGPDPAQSVFWKLVDDTERVVRQEDLHAANRGEQQ